MSNQNNQINMSNQDDYEYKLRAECRDDVTEMEKIFNKNGIKLKDLEVVQFEYEGMIYPDVDVEFKSNTKLDEIIKILKQDGEHKDIHVLIQTLEYSKDYTGERVYER